MDNKEGNMERDLNNFGEAERSFEISQETVQELGGKAVEAKMVDDLIAKAEQEVKQKVKEDNLNAAYDEVMEVREEVQKGI